MLRPIIAAALIATACSACFAHNHVGVNAVNGQLSIVVGYNPGESYLTIGAPPTRQVLDLGSPFIVRAPDTLGQSGEYNGWFSADELLLTSDFYATNLTGGDIYYEIVSFVPVAGTVGDPAATIVWGQFSSVDSTFAPSAIQGAPARIDRSFHVGVGSHQHNQGFAIGGRGVYDLTLIAWDANGVFADSDPVTFRIATTCPADYDADGVVAVADIFAYLNGWFAGDVRADFNGSETVEVQDIFDFLNAWFQGCE
jgi:hypothetical protein